jgi:hypothetical protein
MSATGYTPISLYYSTTAAATPTAGNLANGELAINITDGKLFYKDNSGVVQTLATKASVTNVSSITFGSTGLTPSTATTGAVTVAGTLVAGNGGTGLSTYTTGDLLYASGSATLSKLGIGTTNYVLTAGVSAPQYVAQSTLSVGSATTATTATNLAGGAASQIPYQTTAGSTSFIANGTSGQVLTSNGTSAPTWQTSTGISTGKSIAMALIFGF